MGEVALMDPSKTTDNKLRWQADVEGVNFKLYIPKWRVPRPWPIRKPAGNQFSHMVARDSKRSRGLGAEPSWA
jgi:hypothetical protein